ncbi:MAG TPA: hypothetical protein VHE13_01300 [Opitutus sp.]|nr:hypothetical protein [Opitutus sp.]
MPRAKDLLLSGLALSTAALGWIVWWQAGEIRGLESAVASVAPVAPAAVHVSRVLSRVYAAIAPREENGIPEAGPERTGAEFIPPGLRGAGDIPRHAGAGDMLGRLMQDPEFVAALSQQRYALLDARFAALFRRLDLDPGELARFKRLLVEKDNVALDVITVGATGDAGTVSPELVRDGVRVAQAQVDREIAASLGSERYGVYRDYERTLAQRAVVVQLEQRLSYTPTPLTVPQADALVQILAANNSPARSAGAREASSVVVRADSRDPVSFAATAATTTEVTDAALTAAQSVLAPAQLAALREIQAGQQAGARAADIIRALSPNGEIPAVLLPLLLQ